jgi:hypothetical protein
MLLATDRISVRLTISVSPTYPSSPNFLRECLRITHPGGIVRITDGEWEFDRLYQQLSVEMQEPRFRGLWFFLSVWGTKPERS